jgi:hypothetical protein
MWQNVVQPDRLPANTMQRRKYAICLPDNSEYVTLISFQWQQSLRESA